MANEATIQKKGTHYAWWVMIGYGMLMCATIGAVTVMGGLFYYPVCDELGFNFSTFTFYVTLSMIFMALGMPRMRQDSVERQAEAFRFAHHSRAADPCPLRMHVVVHRAMDVVRRGGSYWAGSLRVLHCHCGSYA